MTVKNSGTIVHQQSGCLIHWTLSGRVYSGELVTRRGDQTGYTHSARTFLDLVNYLESCISYI